MSFNVKPLKVIQIHQIFYLSNIHIITLHSYAWTIFIFISLVIRIRWDYVCMLGYEFWKDIKKKKNNLEFKHIDTAKTWTIKRLTNLMVKSTFSDYIFHQSYSVVLYECMCQYQFFYYTSTLEKLVQYSRKMCMKFPKYHKSKNIFYVKTFSMIFMLRSEVYKFLNLFVKNKYRDTLYERWKRKKKKRLSVPSHKMRTLSTRIFIKYFSRAVWFQCFILISVNILTRFIWLFFFLSKQNKKNVRLLK